MFPIIDARFLGPGVKQFTIKAPRIARKQRPGQFVIVRLHENGERIPLTIKGSDPDHGTIQIVVQSIGKTTHLLNSRKKWGHTFISQKRVPSTIESMVCVGSSPATSEHK